MVRPINRDCPQEREAALRLLKLIQGVVRESLELDDILAHGSVDEDDNLGIAVHGLRTYVKVNR